MSLFRDERPVLAKISLDQVSAPAGSDGPIEGDVWNDSVQKTLFFKLNGLKNAFLGLANLNQTAVTATNPSAAANLISFSVPAGSLNVLGKALNVFGAGLYTTAAAQTPTMTIAVKLGSVTIATWTTNATTASSTSFPWNFDLTLIVGAAGASGTVESHGVLNVTLGAAAAGQLQSYNDVNTAQSSAIDLTAAQTLQVTALFSTANAGNSISQRAMTVEVLN